jgi:FMN phosphatase YigB (HAD superfamily)
LLCPWQYHFLGGRDRKVVRTPQDQNLTAFGLRISRGQRSIRKEGFCLRYRYVLFDLDGTLLPMNKKAFLRGYLGAVASRVAADIPPQEFIDHLLAATHAMIDNNDPTLTNREVFRRDFYPRSGLMESAAEPAFERFYREDFPALAALTQPTPTAREVLHQVQRYGAELIIATNPVFPEIAIRERLRWAGAEEFAFRLVTTYEIMHFCKPKPQYYEEIAAYLNTNPENCLMVGNDVEEDMIAGEIGMATYLVEDHLIDRGIYPARPDHRGRLQDLIAFFAGF